MRPQLTIQHLYSFIILLALRTLEQQQRNAQPLALPLLIERDSYMILTTEYIYIYLPLGFNRNR